MDCCFRARVLGKNAKRVLVQLLVADLLNTRDKQPAVCLFN